MSRESTKSISRERRKGLTLLIRLSLLAHRHPQRWPARPAPAPARPPGAGVARSWPLSNSTDIPTVSLLLPPLLLTAPTHSLPRSIFPMLSFFRIPPSPNLDTYTLSCHICEHHQSEIFCQKLCSGEYNALHVQMAPP